MAHAALVMSIIKIALDLFVFYLKRKNQTERHKHLGGGKSCLNLIKGSQKDVCTNVLFKHKCKNGICPREQCAGFVTELNPEDYSNALLVSPLFLTLKKCIDVFPELAAALLALSLILE